MLEPGRASGNRLGTDGEVGLEYRPGLEVDRVREVSGNLNLGVVRGIWEGCLAVQSLVASDSSVSLLWEAGKHVRMNEKQIWQIVANFGRALKDSFLLLPGLNHAGPALGEFFWG